MACAHEIGMDQFCPLCIARQQGAADERMAIITLIVEMTEEFYRDKPAYGLSGDFPYSELTKIEKAIEARGQQVPQTEEDLSPLERERLAIITQLEYRWSMAGGAKRDGLTEAIQLVKSRNVQPATEEPAP